MRAARLTEERFDPRPDFDPSYMRNPGIARVWYSPEIARYKQERGARPLADGAATGDLAFGSEEWLVGEIHADRGEAVVLEPAELRELVAERAHALADQLHESASRVAGRA
jgi:predicted DNA-binding transcriptional regulator YafY